MTSIIDYEIKNKYSYCVHIADVHIRNEDGDINSRFIEYKIVFDNLLIDIKNKKIKKINTIIVLAGDIFHDARKEKGRTTANAVLLFKDFIQSLMKYGTVVVIPGNHDNNITYQTQSKEMTDTLTSIFKDMKGLDKNLLYLKKTGIYKIGNCLIYTASVFDLDCIKGNSNYIQRQQLLPKKIKNNDFQDYNHICLLHCGVQSQKLSNGHLLKDYDFSINDLDDYDITMLGDTHQHQFLGDKENIAYPSSLIQQNYGESLNNHGYILWNLETKKGQFYDIPNDFGFVSINLIDKNITNIDITNIIFPKKSKIIIKHNQMNEQFLIQFKENIQQKTEIIEWKIRKQINIEKKENNIESINNTEMFLKFLKTKYNEDTKEYNFINNQIKEVIQKNKYSGNNIWNLKKLVVHNFQNYKGNHELLNFIDFDENQIISILGKNASGKSTIGRALSYVIWGKDIYNIDTYVNNESDSMKCQLEFTYNNQKYIINRQYQKKNSKEELQIFSYENNNKIDITESHKTHTQDKILKIFGRREDAKTTWLCEQNSSADFLNNNNNVDIFTKIVGIDHFVDEYHKTIKEKNNLMKENNDIQKNIQLINNHQQQFENIENNIELKQNHLNKLKIEETQIIEKINQENEKKKFGTQQDYSSWIDNVKENQIKIDEFKNNTIGINEDTFQLKENEYNQTLKELQNKKNKFLLEIQTNPIIHLQEKEIIELENIMKQNNNEMITEELYDKTISEIAILENIIQQNNEIYQKMKLKQQTINEIIIQTNIELDYNELNQLKQNIKDDETQIKINNGIIGKFSFNDFHQNISNLKSLQTKLDEQEINKNIIEQQIITEKKNIHVINDTIDTIHQKINEIEIKETTIKKQISEMELIDNNIENIKLNLDKYKYLKFQQNCECCQNNKQYFKIDILETNLIEIEKNKIQINEQIKENTIFIENNSQYKEIKKKYNQNCEIQLKIQNLETKIEIIISSINLNKKQIKDNENIIETLKQKFNIHKQNQQLINEKEKKIEIYNHKNTEYTQNKMKQELKNNIENEMKILKQQVINEKELEIKNKKINELKQQIKSYSIKEQINEYYKLNKIKQNNIIIEEKIKTIDNENQIINQHIQNNKIKYEKYKQQFISIEKNISYNEKTTTKIKTFQNFNQEIIDIYEKDLVKIKENIIEISNVLYYNKQQTKELQKNQQQINILNNQNHKILLNIDLLEKYIQILDPIKGYPKKLMDNNLQILTDKVNQFIHFAGFQYVTEFKCPEIKDGSKNKKNKIVITHTKKNKYFSKLSGAEEFTFNLATLTALGQMSNISNSPILFIDEGFSSLDEDHLNQIEQILTHLKTQFKYVLNISHISSIHQYADIRIQIDDAKLTIEK